MFGQLDVTDFIYSYFWIIITPKFLQEEWVFNFRNVFKHASFLLNAIKSCLIYLSLIIIYDESYLVSPYTIIAYISFYRPISAHMIAYVDSDRIRSLIDYGKGPFSVQNLKLKRRFCRIVLRSHRVIIFRIFEGTADRVYRTWDSRLCSTRSPLSALTWPNHCISLTKI